MYKFLDSSYTVLFILALVCLLAGALSGAKYMITIAIIFILLAFGMYLIREFIDT